MTREGFVCMNLRLTRLHEYLRSSLWLIPSGCLLIAFLLAEVALRIDENLDQHDTNWFLFGGGADSARAVVGTIATSMLTFTGLVFSVTMLVLQLASNQLSPRVMRTFLRDRASQMVLGVFVGTLLYAMLILRRITSQTDGTPFIPALSIWLAMVFVLLSIGLFIFFLHHMAQAIRPVSVMMSVTKETRSAIERLYPEGIGKSVEIPVPDIVRASGGTVSSPGSGVITGVDEERIATIASDSASIVELRAMVGDFVREGSTLFVVHGQWNSSDDSGLQASVALGSERIMKQDAAFGFRQLVDIANRALSPGINDPTTAVQSLDHIHELLGLLASRSIPSACREVDGQLSVILPRLGWSDYVSLACDEIRRSGHDQIQIQRRLRAMLMDLLQTVAHPSRRQPLTEQLELLDASVDGFKAAELVRAVTPSSRG
ncbi:MAG: DUF2254 domain-containing protein [Tepidiformaceae bacterium]